MPGQADQPLLSAAAMLGDGIASLPERVVLVFDESHMPKQPWRPWFFDARRSARSGPFRAVTNVEGRYPVAVVAAVGPGAPTAAVSVEFLAHLGVRAMVSVGVAGDLLGDRSRAMVFSVSSSVAEDGTSGRYGSHTSPDHDLAKRLADKTGNAGATAVTTDTPLRHTTADISRFRKTAQLIEMETAALFSAAHHLGVAAGAFLVTSDGYQTTEQGITWSPGNQDIVKPAVTSAVSEAIDVLARYRIPVENRDTPGRDEPGRATPGLDESMIAEP